VFEQKIEERKMKILNKQLTLVEREVYLAIKFGDSFKLKDLGGMDHLNLNYRIEVEKGVFYYPIMLAAAIGEVECLKIILHNS